MVNNMQILNLGDAGSRGNDLLAKRLAEGLDVSPRSTCSADRLEWVRAFASRPATMSYSPTLSWLPYPLGDQRTRVSPHVQSPLGGRVFFGGEHTDDRVGPGGLEGATRSGLRAATELASA